MTNLVKTIISLKLEECCIKTIALGKLILRFIIIFFMLFYGQTGFSQEFFVIDNERRLFLVDISNCRTTFIKQVSLSSSITDITFHPNEKLYGIATNGRLVEIDIETGNTTTVHQFSRNLGEFFTSLVADQEGIIYATGTEGFLYSYNVNTRQPKFHGKIPFGAAGDLTFFQGRLFMASIVNDMVEINIDHPEMSSVFMDFDVGGNVFGIVTFVQDCDQTVTYATTNHGEAKIYAIDLQNNSLELSCTVPFSVYGAASELEHIASNPIVVHDIATSVSNCGATDGSITINATGGVGIKSFSLNQGAFQVNNAFVNLAPGIYTVDIKDESSCHITLDIEVPSSSPPPVIEQVIAHATTCGEPNGAFQIIAGEGTGQLSYSLDNINYHEEGNFANLIAGTHTVFVKDELECLITTPVEVQASQTPEIIDLQIQACGPTGNTISVLMAEHDHPVSFSHDENTYQSESDFKNLNPGVYTIQVKDTIGCIDQASVEIPVVNPLNIELEASTACTNQEGSIQVMSTGGTGVVRFSLNGSTIQESSNFQNLSPAIYQVTAMDEFGCTVQSDITIDPFEELSIQDMITHNGNCAESNGVVEVVASGGHGQLHYKINDTNTLQPENAFHNLDIGEHHLEVIDEKGCTVAASFTLATDCPLYIPNAFSPNNDGVNDYFQVYSPFDFQVEVFRVFDRWGGLLFENDSFTISEAGQFWDGTVGGQLANDGIYLYQIEITNELGEKEFYAGDVMLVK